MSGGRGLFLALEGVEGSGKSTQIRRLVHALQQRGASVVVAREPGSTPLGERVRETVLGDAALGIPARSELFLMLAARAAFVDQVVRPACQGGAIVIADRFELSTLAYQGAGRGLPLGRIRAINRFATGGVAPDATVLLQLDPAEGVRRQRQAGKLPDRMEQEDARFHLRVAKAYARLASRIPGVIPVPADAPEEEVERRIWAHLARRFPETFAEGGVL